MNIHTYTHIYAYTHIYVYINKYACWPLHAYACTYYRPTCTDTRDYPERKAQQCTFTQYQTIPQPLPIPILINSTDLSEVNAWYWSKLFLFSSDVGV